MVEILRCPGCGFRVKGFPGQYLHRRTVDCPRCRVEITLSVEDRLRLKRLMMEGREMASREAGGRTVF